MSSNSPENQPASPRTDALLQDTPDAPSEAPKPVPDPPTSTATSPTQGNQQTTKPTPKQDKESPLESPMLVESSDIDSGVVAHSPGVTCSNLGTGPGDFVCVKCRTKATSDKMVGEAASASGGSPATTPDKEDVNLETGEQEEKMDEDDPSVPGGESSNDGSLGFIHTDSKELLKSKVRSKGKFRKQVGLLKMEEDSSDSNATLPGELPTFPFVTDSPDRMTPASELINTIRSRLIRDIQRDSSSPSDSSASHTSNSLTGDEVRTSFQRDDSGLMSDNAMPLVDSPVQADLGPGMRTLMVTSRREKGDRSEKGPDTPSTSSSDDKPDKSDDGHHFIPVHPPDKTSGQQSEALKVGVKRPLEPEGEVDMTAACKRRSMELTDEEPPRPILIQSAIVQLSDLRPMIEAARQAQAQQSPEIVIPTLPKRKHSSSEEDEGAESASKLRKIDESSSPGPSGLQEAPAERSENPPIEEPKSPGKESQSSEDSANPPEERPSTPEVPEGRSRNPSRDV